MKHLSKLTLAAVAMISFFTACNNVEDLDDLQKPGTEIPGTGEETATGTKENPYSIADLIKKNPSSTTEALEKEVWVEGYIVGNFDFNSTPKDQIGKQDTYPSDVNVYLADSKDETSAANCASIQILGTTRGIVGLNTNPANFGKLLKIKGNILRYNSHAGLKETTEFELEGYTPEEGGDNEGDNTTSEVEICGDATAVATYSYDFNDVTNNVNFANADWKSVVVSGDRQWRGATFEENGYIKATAHGATDGTSYESWVISPALDITNAASKVVSFKTAQAYWVDGTVFEVYVLQCVDGKTVRTALQPTVATASTPNYEFVESGELDLSKFTGIAYIGFRYVGMGGQSKAGTWCIDDFSFGGGEIIPVTTVAIKYGTASVETNAALNCEITTTVTNAVGATTITATGLPSWAAFKDNGDGTATITGTAPAAAEEATITITAVNNNIEATKTFTLKVTAPSEAGSELVINGGFETWADEAKPTGWDNNYTMPVITKSTDIKHSGNNSLRQTSTDATLKVQQEIAVTPGKKYKLSYWYLDNDTNASSKFWGTWVDTANKAMDADKATLQWAKFSTDSAEWQYVEVTVTAPENAGLIRFETRTYRGATADGSGLADKGVNGGYIYYDDFSMTEVQ